MKKLFFIASLFVCTASFSQELSFEETVKDINDKIQCCSGNSTMSVKISKNGDVLVRGKDFPKFNLFTIEKRPKLDLSEDYYIVFEEYKGLVFYAIEGFGATTYNIGVNGVTEPFIFRIKNEDIGKRLMKAFKHLRSRCIEKKDPINN